MNHLKRKRKEEEEVSYWLSYSDMMAALLLIFVLIITFTMLKSQEHVENLDSQQVLLKERQEQLTSQQELLSVQQQQVDDLRAQNEEKESELEQQKALVESQQKALSEQQAQVEELRIQNEEKEAALEQQKTLVESQQKALSEQQAQVDELKIQNEEKEVVLSTQQQKLDKLVGIRTSIIEALVHEFEDTNLSIDVDDKTGAIIFDSSILFEFGKFQLKDSGENFLDEFFPRYVGILQSEEFQPYIAEIIIEGHTDSVGTYLDNLELSQTRALAVARYCLSEENSVLDTYGMEQLRKIVTANGRSYSNLILKEDGTEDADASRRVEFKFRLTEDEMIQEMKEILAN